MWKMTKTDISLFWKVKTILIIQKYENCTIMFVLLFLYFGSQIKTFENLNCLNLFSENVKSQPVSKAKDRI